MKNPSLFRYGIAAAIGMAAMLIAIWFVIAGEADTTSSYLCLSLVLGLALSLAVASGRPALGMMLSGGLFGTLCFASAVKLEYLHEPVLVPDLRYFLNADTLGVIGKYPDMLHGLWIVLVVAIIILALLLWLESPGLWRGRQRWRLPAFVLSLLPIALMMWPNGPFHKAFEGGAWDYIANSAANPVTSFVRSFGRMALEQPDYDPADAARIDWGRAAAVPANGQAQLPDIVIVLEESAIDPREWAVCDLPQCTLRMFQPDARTAAHGDLQVHTYGGATWTSEFALLAGIPSTLFGAAGIYAPYNLAPRMRDALPQLLKSRGYRTIAVYPMPGDFVNAESAYAHYGFDKFIDGNEIGQKWETTDVEEVQKFSAIYQRERAATTQPLFFMLLTLREHGPHDGPLDKLPAPYDQPLFPKLDAASNRNLGNYLARLHQSDAAIDALERLVLDGPRPAVLAHFGDHHPSFDGLEQKLDLVVPAALKSVASSLTYYVIKTNLPNPKLHSYQALDLAFLGGLILDVAGVPKDAYFQANSTLRERCLGRFVECADQRVLAPYFVEIFGRLRVVDR